MLAQSGGEPQLEDLIPEEAVRDPEGWATGDSAAAAPAAPPVLLDPQSPLDPAPELELPWPDLSEEPALVTLEPEPGIAAAAEALGGDLPPVAGQSVAATAHDNVSRPFGRVELAFPAAAAIPERAEIEDRFTELSTLRNLGYTGDGPLIARRAREDRDLLAAILRNYGYYDAEVVNGLGQADQASGEVALRFLVTPGGQYRYDEVNLGDLPATGGDYPRLRAAFPIMPGDPVNADHITLAQGSLDLALAESGYVFARMREPELTVDHAVEQADLTLPLSTGGKYAFGAIVSGNEGFLNSRHLSRIARFSPGDIYRRTLAQDLRSAVLATGLVSSVTVTPRETAPPGPGTPGTVAIDVGMVPAPLRTLAGAIGYSTGEGFRIEGSWEHRNLLPPEGMLRLRAVAGTREQLAGVTFRRNNFTGRDRVLTLDLFGRTEQFTAYDARTVSFIGTFERITTLLYQKTWAWSVGIEAVASQERENAIDGGVGARRTFFIGAFPGRLAFDASNDLLDPTSGFRLAGRVSPEVSAVSGAESYYVRGQLDGSVYQAVTDSVTLAARARFGSIGGAPIAQIAPSRRLYAGGGGSVRGYGYQAIGPRDTLGTPTGGRSLSEVSFEARIRTGLFGGLSIVPFIDAGAVDETPHPKLADLRFGAGLGVRYHTGFGPIRVDVATPLNRHPGDGPVAVYVALGQAF